MVGRYGYDLFGKPSRSQLTKAFDVFQSLSECNGSKLDPGMYLVAYLFYILNICEKVLCLMPWFMLQHDVIHYRLTQSIL